MSVSEHVNKQDGITLMLVALDISAVVSKACVLKDLELTEVLCHSKSTAENTDKCDK